MPLGKPSTYHRKRFGRKIRDRKTLRHASEKLRDSSKDRTRRLATKRFSGIRNPVKKKWNHSSACHVLAEGWLQTWTTGILLSSIFLSPHHGNDFLICSAPRLRLDMLFMDKALSFGQKVKSAAWSQSKFLSKKQPPPRVVDQAFFKLTGVRRSGYNSRHSSQTLPSQPRAVQCSRP